MDDRSAASRSGAGPRGAPELVLRSASALLLGILALGSAALGGWPLAIVWSAAGALVAYEWLAMTGVERAASLRIVLPAAAAGTGLAVMAGAAPAGAVLAAGSVLAVLLGQSLRDRLWAVAGLWCAALLAGVPIIVRTDPALGIIGLLWMFAIVWTTDVAAYFAGRSLGGPRLWPRVSPKKTWSGFIGGTVAGTCAGIVMLVGVGNWPMSLSVAVASCLGSLVGQGGDLAESAMKRAFGVKDSGRLIPGHGGFMDRLDGFWAVCLLVGAGLAVREVLR